jgi:hypothetical protein
MEAIKASNHSHWKQPLTVEFCHQGHTMTILNHPNAIHRQELLQVLYAAREAKPA